MPALKVDGRFVANPLVVTDRMIDEFGRFVFGEPKTGDARRPARRCWRAARSTSALLDAKVEALCAKLLLTMPGCLTKTVESCASTSSTRGTATRRTPAPGSRST